MSFKKAAEELFITPAAVSYQIKLLEQQLGVKLFVRKNRKISLTARAQNGIANIKQAFETLNRGVKELSAKSDRHTLVVSAGPAVTLKWLAPRLYDFHGQFPNIDVRLSANMSFSDFYDDDVDMAIRFGNPVANPQNRLFVEKLANDSIAPMISPNLLKDIDISHPGEILQFGLIHDDSMAVFDASIPDWDAWLVKYNLAKEPSTTEIHLSQSDYALQSAIDGNGVILGRKMLAASDLKQKRLITLLPQTTITTNLAYYFICPREKIQTGPVQAFRLWIKSELARLSRFSSE